MKDEKYQYENMESFLAVLNASLQRCIVILLIAHFRKE